MTNRPTRYRKKAKAQPPERITNARERGQALQAWLDEHDYAVLHFARDAEISRSRMVQLLSGELDLADLPNADAHRLLDTMMVPDDWAWEYLAIPVEKRANFHSWRPRPLGQAPLNGRLQTLYLDGPLYGDVSAPVGYPVIYDADARDGMLLTRSGERYLSLRSEDVDASTAMVLGKLLHVDTSAPPLRDVRPRSPERS